MGLAYIPIMLYLKKPKKSWSPTKQLPLLSQLTPLSAMLGDFVETNRLSLTSGVAAYFFFQALKATS